MNNIVEKEINKMITDLNMANDEFVNDYFEDFEQSPQHIETGDILIETDNISKEEPLDINNDELNKIKEPVEKPKYNENRPFSYNEILSKLDNYEKKIVEEKPTDLIKLIDKAENAEEFFEKVEMALKND